MKIKILFMHNSMPEYRLPWFSELNELCDCKFWITNPTLSEKIYNTKINKDKIQKLDYQLMEGGIKGYRELRLLLKSISAYDFVEFPPIDSFGELVKSVIVMYYTRKYGIKTGYFWEKWEAPSKLQPIGRKVKNKILKVAAKIIFKRVDVVFCSGSKSKEYFLSAGVQKNKISTIPDSSEAPRCINKDLRKQLGISSNKKIILYFGRIIEQKGLDKLICAIADLEEKEKKNIYLLVAGDGPYRMQCEKMAQRLQLCEYKFVGAVNPDDRYNYFIQCDIFVHPGIFYKGRTDVWGLTLNEALQFGKIIISTTAVGASYDLIVNGQNGYMVEQNSIEALRDALRSSITNKDLQQKAKDIDEKLYLVYNYKNMAVKYLEAVENILGKEVDVYDT